jgi:hypothetical protein
VTGFENPVAVSALEEIVGLHGFFESWLRGHCPDTDAAFARLEAALAESFSIVTPDGERLGRTEVVARLRQAHGSKGRHGLFRIAILDPEVLYDNPPLVVLGYVEEQVSCETVTRRRATALLESAQGPGLQWLAVHETWIGSDRRIPRTGLP